jgi:hypothetical protein
MMANKPGILKTEKTFIFKNQSNQTQGVHAKMHKPLNQIVEAGLKRLLGGQSLKTRKKQEHDKLSNKAYTFIDSSSIYQA